jgi:putative ABC transport system permease protein
VSVPGARVSRDFFALLGVSPILGRTFLTEEEQEGNDRVAIISESLWRSRFQADPALVGKAIVIDGEKHEVAGIVSASFRPLYARAAEVFRPLALSRAEAERRTGNYNYAAIIRVKPGIAAAQALAEINVVQARFQNGLKATLIPAHEVVTGRAQAGLWMLAAAVGAVLRIVCVNLANLLLSRMTSRSRESAIRAALGASRVRQFCQVLTESLLLAACGGGLGLIFAAWTIQLLAGASTLDIPRLAEVRLDFGVLAFAFALTLLTGLLFGALPAWHFTRQAPQEALRAGSHTVTTGRRGLRIREALIGLEVGLSATLLIVAGLLATSLTRLLHVDKGFDASRVVTVNVGLAGRLYADPSNCERFFDRVLAKLGATPGVQAAGITTTLPSQGDTWNDPIYLEGDGRRREDRHPVNNRYASPGFFRAMNMIILRGRAFDESDRGQSVAVLSEKAAKLLWPADANPVGRRFIGEDDKPKVLVGLVAEVRAVLERDPPATAYYPYWQRPPGAAALVVRTTSSAEAAAPVIRAALRAEDAGLPIQAIRTMDELVDQSVVGRRFQLTLMLAFAGAALLVASLGIYGVVAYSVARRRNEIGIRMALGGGRSQLLWLVLRQGMAPVVFGLAVGVAAALLLGQAIRGLLFGVRPSDPLTIAGVAMVLLTVGALACLVPARRATGRDALEALRFE